MHPYGLGTQQTSQSAVSHPALFIACCGVWRWQLQVGQRASQSERDSVEVRMAVSRRHAVKMSNLETVLTN